MRIKTIKKGSLGKYKITLVNGEVIQTYDELIIKYGILFKKEITPELIKQMLSENIYYDSYHKTVKYIIKKMRSQKEIEVYLAKFGLTEGEQDALLQKLREEGLVNDTKFAQAYVVDHMNLTSDGPDKIRHDLEQNKIASDVMNAALSTVSEEQVITKLERLLLKKIKGNHKYSTALLRQKLISEFQMKGYDRDMINTLLDQYLQKDTSILEKEVIKQQKRLSKKYADQELYYQLQNKLYQKGYTKEEIREVLTNMEN